ncbi:MULTISPECIES: MBL fold metallo-hydrolase [Klebsiella pneumoniae complex]|uniref:MBL fold metallo-hydrolase n=1 Tax=Klebsiella pneumoniae complex TaxID=3390273 RepID=UPI000907C1B2|nr:MULTISPECIES: MBL fold metallo-hydrolase [Klebsiella]MDD7846252.1 MBL fold metallo-hydrolase [Klebsiella quasipneumoniae]MDD7859575.1 MBL fold metallo-hydrolase [Klebsiella quasipneumoniae]MDF8307748.1 MBL fold metallo-hydrolase [Klebsiella quasipneumoniae]
MSQSQNFQCKTVIFGKGIGESIVIQLAENEWMIIDSCLNNQMKPAALEYLSEKGVDLESQVKLIVISHFHDDHIKGMHEIIKQCKNAKVVISAALNTQEFKSYINALSVNGEEMAKTQEIKNVMSLLPTLLEKKQLIIAKRDCTLYRSKDNLEVKSLSPSDNDISRSILDFANWLKYSKNANGVTCSARLINPNHYCVVTRVFSQTSGNDEILLGADLETSAHSGWDDVCDAIDSPRPNKVGLFKLPHHGSQTGFHQRTWDELIRSKPISILTTYDRSSLPREDMIEKYKNHSASVYCTSKPKSHQQSKKEETRIPSDALKMLSKLNSTVQISRSLGKFGYITVENCLTSNPNVKLYHAALAL